MNRLLTQFVARPTLIAPARFQSLAISALKPRADLPDFGAPENWYPKAAAEEYRVENGVGIVPIHGVICRGMSAVECAFYDLADADRILSDLRRAASDPAAMVIRLDINSPGGAVPLVAEIGAMVARISESKLVVARVDELCASAAMWIAAGASHIAATIGADVGSIGVYCQVFDYTAALAEWGIKVETFKTGALKATGALGTQLTEDQRRYLQANVDECFAEFSAFIRAQRGAVADDTMQGQCFSAKEALARNLVDEIFNDGAEIDAACAVAAARLLAKK